MTTTTVAPQSTAPLGELHFHRLLVAIDGSLNGELALSAAVTAARRDHAALTLICVARDVIADTARTAAAYWGPPESQEEADAWAERTLREAAARVPDDVSVTTVVRRGRAAREILAQLDEQPYDAILLGARGLGRVAVMMGSVSREVLHRAEVPAFVAHAPRVEARVGG
jgi:nucleotide-binding universal stress UspA family protein